MWGPFPPPLWKEGVRSLAGWWSAAPPQLWTCLPPRLGSGQGTGWEGQGWVLARLGTLQGMGAVDAVSLIFQHHCRGV